MWRCLAGFNFGNYLKNSMLVTCAVVILNLLFTPMVGYSLAKFDFPGKNLLLLFVLATIMVPFTAILVPLFLIIRSFGWVNTYPGADRALCHVGFRRLSDAPVHGGGARRLH